MSDTEWSPPLLRWAGSKRKLIPHLRARVPSRYNRYIEPFAGSACLFFALRPRQAIISDLNIELIQAYRVLRSHPRLLSRAVHNFGYSHDYYYIRSLNPAALEPIQRAARFIYLNRTCFNGVFRTNRRGEFNVPRGTRTGSLPHEAAFYRCSFALRRADLRHSDFEQCLHDARRHDFVYLDPPYARGNRPGYGEYGYGSFGSQDIPRLIACLKNLDRVGARFLLSFTADHRLLDAIGHWTCSRLLVRHYISGFANHRSLVEEIMITN
jgi:DNA adenine methylase